MPKITHILTPEQENDKLREVNQNLTNQLNRVNEHCAIVVIVAVVLFVVILYLCSLLSDREATIRSQQYKIELFGDTFDRAKQAVTTSREQVVSMSAYKGSTVKEQIKRSNEMKLERRLNEMENFKERNK